MKNLPYKLYLRMAKRKAIAISDCKDRRTALQWICAIDNDKNSLKSKEHGASLLLYCLQRKRLVGPFKNAPSTKKNLQEFIFNYNSKDLAELMLQEDVKEFEKPSVAVELSGDLCEYVAYQDIPSFGSHFYYAFSPEPVKKWENIKDFIIPRGLLTLTSLSVPDTSILAKELNQPKSVSKPASPDAPVHERHEQFIDASILKDTGELKSGFIHEQEQARDVDTKLLAAALRSNILNKSDIHGDITIDKILDPHVEQVEVKKTDRSFIKKKKKNVTPHLEPLLDEIVGPMHYVETYEEYKAKQKLDLTSKSLNRKSNISCELDFDKGKPEQDICTMPSRSRKPLLERLQQLQHCQRPTPKPAICDETDFEDDKPESTKFEDFLSKTIVGADEANMLKAQTMEEQFENLSSQMSDSGTYRSTSLSTESEVTPHSWRGKSTSVIPEPEIRTGSPVAKKLDYSSVTTPKKTGNATLVDDVCVVEDKFTTPKKTGNATLVDDACVVENKYTTPKKTGNATLVDDACVVENKYTTPKKTGNATLVDDACAMVDKSMNADQEMQNVQDAAADADNADIMMVYNWARNLSTLSEEKDGKIITTPEADQITHELTATIRRGDQEETRRAVLTTTQDVSPYMDSIRNPTENLVHKTPFLCFDQNNSPQSAQHNIRTPTIFSPYGPDFFQQQEPSPSFPMPLPPISMSNLRPQVLVYDEEGRPYSAPQNIIDQPMPNFLVPPDPSLVPSPVMQSGEQCIPMANISQQAQIYDGQGMQSAPVSNIHPDDECLLMSDFPQNAPIYDDQGPQLVPVSNIPLSDECVPNYRQHNVVFDEYGMMHLEPVDYMNEPIPELILPLGPSLVASPNIQPVQAVTQSPPPAAIYRSNQGRGDLIQMSPQHGGICENVKNDLSILDENEMALADDMFADHLVSEPVPVSEIPMTNMLEQMCEQLEPVYGNLSEDVSILSENDMVFDDMFRDDMMAEPVPVSQMPMPNTLEQMAEMLQPVYGDMSQDVTILDENEMNDLSLCSPERIKSPQREQMPLRATPSPNVQLSKRTPNIPSGTVCPPRGQVPLMAKPTPQRTPNVASGRVCPPKTPVPLMAKPTPQRTTNVPSGTVCPPKTQAPLRAKPAPRVPISRRPPNVPSGTVCPPKTPVPLMAKPTPQRTTNVPSGTVCPPKTQAPLRAKPAPRVPISRRPPNVPSGTVCPPRGQMPLSNKQAPGAPMSTRTPNVPSGTACPPRGQAPLRAKPTPRVPISRRPPNVPSGTACPPRGQAPRPSMSTRTPNVASGAACPPRGQAPLSTKQAPRASMSTRTPNVPSGLACPPRGQAAPTTTQRSTLQLSKSIKQAYRQPSTSRIPAPSARPAGRTGIPMPQQSANRHAGGQTMDDLYNAESCDLPFENGSTPVVEDEDECPISDNDYFTSKVEACMLKQHEMLSMKERERVFACHGIDANRNYSNLNASLSRRSPEKSMGNDTAINSFRGGAEPNEWSHLVKKVLRDGDCGEVNDFFCFNIDPDDVRGILLTTANIYTVSPKDGIPQSHTRLFEDVACSMADAGYDTTLESHASSTQISAEELNYQDQNCAIPLEGNQRETEEVPEICPKQLECPVEQLDQGSKQFPYEISGGVFSNIEPEEEESCTAVNDSIARIEGLIKELEKGGKVEDLRLDSPLLRQLYPLKSFPIAKQYADQVDELIFREQTRTEALQTIKDRRLDLIQLGIYDPISFRSVPPPPARINWDQSIDEIKRESEELLDILVHNNILVADVIDRYYDEDAQRLPKSKQKKIPPQCPINQSQQNTSLVNKSQTMPKSGTVQSQTKEGSANSGAQACPQPTVSQTPRRGGPSNLGAQACPQPTFSQTQTRGGPSNLGTQACPRPSASRTQTRGGPSNLGAQACPRPSASRTQTRGGPSNLGTNACRQPSKQNLQNPSQKPRWR